MCNAMRSSSSYVLLSRSFQKALASLALGACRTSCRDETAPIKAKLECLVSLIVESLSSSSLLLEVLPPTSPSASHAESSGSAQGLGLTAPVTRNNSGSLNYEESEDTDV